MATKEIELTILTPQQSVFSGLVQSVVVPAYDGYLGVLTGHAPFICLLKQGRITARTAAQPYDFTINGGLMEVIADKVTILTDLFASQEPVDNRKVPANTNPVPA